MNSKNGFCVMLWSVALLSIVVYGCDASKAEENDNGGSDGDTDTDSDTDADGDTGSDTGDGLAGPCPLDQKVGAFQIVHRTLYSAITGQVAEGVLPATILFPEDSEGMCRLMRQIYPFCDPPCDPGEVCNHDEQCVPYPKNKNAGQISVTGLNTEVTLSPNPVDNLYQDTSLPDPPFAPDAPIHLGAQGAEIESFGLDGFGVTPLEMPDPVWVMRDGEPLEISWTPAADRGDIHATFNVDQHGNSPVTMFCDLEDTGSAVIPAGLISKLIEYGISGFASGHLYRRTVDSTWIAPGCVELEVFSHSAAKLSVQ